MSNIKIFVSCHKESYVPKSDLLIPIQVGTALAKERYEGYVHDDEGDNISLKNKSYCELTAQYWAWKNCKADYYGFFHYRRYMSFIDEQLGDIETYVKFLYCTDEVQQMIGLNEEQIHKVVESYDVITVIPKTLDNNETVRSQYAKFNVHFIEDLDEVCLDIIKAKYPDIYNTAVNYLNGNICYFCNMFIARKNIFERYNKFLFDVLKEFENGKDFAYYNTTQYRVFGYLGERLWGIFYCYLKHIENIKTKELQRVEFTYTHPLAVHNVDCDAVDIVISSSDYYTPYAIVLLKSLAINSKKDRNYNIIVFNLGMKDTNKQLFKNNISDYPNLKITFIDIKPITSRYKLQGKGYVSMHSWLRLFVPFVLSEYDKIIYLDSDMIINHDVSELFDIDVDDVFLAATRDFRVIASGIVFPRRYNYVKETLKIENIYDYFQAGVMVINLKRFRYEFSLDSLMEICQSQKWELLDQDMLNSVLQGKYKLIDPKWDVVADWNSRCKSWIEKLPHDLYTQFMEAYSEPFIVHYGGPYKPWHNPEIDFCEMFWHYAKQSTQSEYILLRAMIEKDSSVKALVGKSLNLKTDKVDNHKNSIMNRIFPKGSKRRTFIKKFFIKMPRIYQKLHERYGL